MDEGGTDTESNKSRLKGILCDLLMGNDDLKHIF